MRKSKYEDQINRLVELGVDTENYKDHKAFKAASKPAQKAFLNRYLYYPARKNEEEQNPTPSELQVSPKIKKEIIKSTSKLSSVDFVTLLFCVLIHLYLMIESISFFGTLDISTSYATILAALLEFAVFIGAIQTKPTLKLMGALSLLISVSFYSYYSYLPIKGQELELKRASLEIESVKKKISALQIRIDQEKTELSTLNNSWRDLSSQNFHTRAIESLTPLISESKNKLNAAQEEKINLENKLLLLNSNNLKGSDKKIQVLMVIVAKLILAIFSYLLLSGLSLKMRALPIDIKKE